MPVTDNFKDSEQASNYQKFRPHYPDSLYSRLIGLLGKPQTSSDGQAKYKLAVDVGCGSGQSTIPMSSHFQQVIGVDPSEAQIEEAKKEVQKRGIINISYRVGLAEKLDFLDNDSVDLVTVGTALHWFDVDKFCEECRRILRPGGVIAAYSYGTGDWALQGEVDQQRVEECKGFYDMLVEKYRDPQVSNVTDRYVRFVPIFEKYFSETVRDESERLEWKFSLEGLKGFVKSISMYQKYKQTLTEGQPNQLDECFDRLAASYNGPPPEDAVLYTSIITVLSGRK